MAAFLFASLYGTSSAIAPSDDHRQGHSMLPLDSRAGKLRRTLFVSWGVVAMRQELGPPRIPGLSGLAVGLGLRLWPAGLGLEWELGMGPGACAGASAGSAAVEADVKCPARVLGGVGQRYGLGIESRMGLKSGSLGGGWMLGCQSSQMTTKRTIEKRELS